MTIKIQSQDDQLMVYIVDNNVDIRFPMEPDAAYRLGEYLIEESTKYEESHEN